MLFLFCIFRHEGVYLAWVVDAGQKKDILYIAFSSAFECPIVFNIAIVARLYFLQKSKMCHTLFFGQKYAHREAIAQANGISDYHGTASQNERLLNLAKAGKLRTAEGSVQEESTSVFLQQADNHSATLLSGVQEPTKDMVQVVNSCQLHEEPYAKADAVTAVTPGDCFEVLGETTNEYGNLWYKVSWAGKISYVFSGHVTKHTMIFMSLLMKRSASVNAVQFQQQQRAAPHS